MTTEQRFKLHNKGIDAAEQLCRDMANDSWEEAHEMAYRKRQQEQAERRQAARDSWARLEATRSDLEVNHD